MVIGAIADRLGRGIEDATHLVSETFFEPVIRLGVTGLSRAGKTVFITSLVANLMDRGRESATISEFCVTATSVTMLVGQDVAGIRTSQ